MVYKTRKRKVKKSRRRVGKGKGDWTTTPITDAKELRLLEKTLANEKIREEKNKKIKQTKDELEQNTKESLTTWATTPMSDKDKARLLRQQEREFAKVNSTRKKRERLIVDDL